MARCPIIPALMSTTPRSPSSSRPLFTSLHGPGQVESIGGTLTVEEAPAPALLAAAGAEGSLEVTKRALEDILHIYDDV